MIISPQLGLYAQGLFYIVHNNDSQHYTPSDA